MKRFIWLMACLALVLGLVAACDTPRPPPAAREYTDNTTPINVVVGQQFILALRSNPTTGFRWDASYDTNLLRLDSSEYKADEAQPGKVGVGGTNRFTFEALKAGGASVTMTYKQPWQGGAFGQTLTFDVRIT